MRGESRTFDQEGVGQSKYPPSKSSSKKLYKLYTE